MKQKSQKRPKPKIVTTHHNNCAYVRVMAVLIIFPVFLQTVINSNRLLGKGNNGNVWTFLQNTFY